MTTKSTRIIGKTPAKPPNARRNIDPISALGDKVVSKNKDIGMEKNIIVEKLIGLNFMLNNIRRVYNSNEIIDYIKKSHIDINTYVIPLPDSEPNCIEYPLIYHCCKRRDLDDLFYYLLENGVDLSRRPCDKDHNDSVKGVDLIVYCDPAYIGQLSKLGCKISPARLEYSLISLVIAGNITKIMTLKKYAVITDEDLFKILSINELPFVALDALYEKIFNLCKEVCNVLPLIEEIISNYIGIFTLFFKNTIGVNTIDDETGDLLSQRILDSYFYDLIKLMIKYKPNWQKLTFYHYSNFPIENKCIMSPIYNECNFKKIEELIRPHMLKRINRISLQKKKT